MGQFVIARRASDGAQFLQWRRDSREEEMPSFGPGHPENNACIVCGESYTEHPVTVGGIEYQRTDIRHNYLLHKRWPGLDDGSGAVSPQRMEPPRRARYQDDDDS